MTNQETFDFVVSALVAQGKPSYGLLFSSANTMGCLYRGPGGTKCAAGHCIPDDKYTSSMENTVVSSAYVEPILEAAGYDVGFLSHMQHAHDDAAMNNQIDNEAWLHSFLLAARVVAKRHQLSTEVVDLAEASIAYAVDYDQFVGVDS